VAESSPPLNTVSQFQCIRVTNRVRMFEYIPLVSALLCYCCCRIRTLVSSLCFLRVQEFKSHLNSILQLTFYSRSTRQHELPRWTTKRGWKLEWGVRRPGQSGQSCSANNHNSSYLFWICYLYLYLAVYIINSNKSTDPNISSFTFARRQQDRNYSWSDWWHWGSTCIISGTDMVVKSKEEETDGGAEWNSATSDLCWSQLRLRRSAFWK
jgi:hypothetical protein